MQPHDNDQCPAQGDTNGGWDAEQSAAEDADWLEFEEDIVEDYRTVCLSASIYGKGGAAS